MREYNTEIEWRLDVNDAYLSQYLAILYRWNKLTVSDEDPEFLDEYNRVISDRSIPNREDYNDTDDEEKEDGYVNMELGFPRKYDGGLMHAIVKKRDLDEEVKDVGTVNNNPLIDNRSYAVEFSDSTTEDSDPQDT